MSVEAASATDAPQQPIEGNAQSAEDVKKMLEELEGEKEIDIVAEVPAELAKTNGNSEETATAKTAPAEGSEEVKAEKEPEAANSSGHKENDDRAQRRSDRVDSRPSRGGRGGGRGGFKPKSFKENIKSDLTTLKETDDPVQIRRQVEFYFSDSNLPMDKFLLEQVGGSKNNPVEIKILHSFKRMRHFQPFEAIVAALKDSSILEVTNDDTCVRRKTPLPESLDNGPDASAVKVFEDRAMPRSVYVKGFGEELPSTQFDIEAFFTPYGPTNAIRLRRSDTKVFKGSVFVEFADEDLQKAFLALDPKPTFRGKDLQIMSKKQYCDQKVEDIKSGKIKGNNNYDRDRASPRSGWSRGNSDFKRKRDDEDNRDWRERREDDRKSGYRDDKRKNHRDRNSRGGRGGRHDRDDRRDRRNQTDRDERGIPIVKETEDGTADNRAKRDAATADALAKAQSYVVAEEKKQNGAGITESAKQGEEASFEEGAGKKRVREEDVAEGEPEAKKVDTKLEHVERLEVES